MLTLLGLLVATAISNAQEASTPQASAVVVALKPMNGRPLEVRGRIVVEDQEGGLLLEDATGVYWSLVSSEITGRTKANTPFQRAATEDLATALRQAAGGESVVVATKNYVIVSRASRAYAE